MWREFKALGTDIIFFLASESEPNNIFKTAEAAVKKFENSFSRFIPGNELAIFNDPNRLEVIISDTFKELLEIAQQYYEKTDGIFDPTIIGSLESLGYDHNFKELDFKQLENQTKLDLVKIQQEFAARKTISDLKISGQQAIKPWGLRVDLGGLGKGYIIDNLSKTIFSQEENFLLSAGGDILAVGNQENANGWDIAVENPEHPGENIFFINTRGERLGVASSGIVARHWLSGQTSINHLIDPRSGLSVANNVLAVTIIAPSAVKADIYAKTVLILGEVAGLEFIERESDSAGIIFTKNKGIIFSKRAGLYLKEKN